MKQTLITTVLALGLVLLSTPSFAGSYVVNGRAASPAEAQHLVASGVQPGAWVSTGMASHRQPSALPLLRLRPSPAARNATTSSTAQSIWNWVHQADRDDGRRRDGATSSEREELTRLRRENRQLRQERDILAKAAAWFARETAVIPSGSSNS